AVGPASFHRRQRETRRAWHVQFECCCSIPGLDSRASREPDPRTASTSVHQTALPSPGSRLLRDISPPQAAAVCNGDRPRIRLPVAARRAERSLFESASTPAYASAEALEENPALARNFFVSRPSTNR